MAPTCTELLAVLADPADRAERPARHDPDPTDVRRQLRVRLLRDLVSAGLYRVDTDVLAGRMLDVIELGLQR